MARKRVCQDCRDPLPKIGPSGMRKRSDTLYCDDCLKKRQYDREQRWMKDNIECVRISKKKYMRRIRKEARDARASQNTAPAIDTA